MVSKRKREPKTELKHLKSKPAMKGEFLGIPEEIALSLKESEALLAASRFARAKKGKLD
jgi:hypothetical protein